MAESIITEEMVEKARHEYLNYYSLHSDFAKVTNDNMFDALRAALEAVIPDIELAVKKKCAKVARNHVHIDEQGNSHNVRWFAESVARAIRAMK